VISNITVEGGGRNVGIKQVPYHVIRSWS
jgi:hypothetical protein